MSDGSEKRPLTKCFGLYLLKQGRSHRLIQQYRTIEQMCSDAHSIALINTILLYLDTRSNCLYIRGLLMYTAASFILF